MTSKLNHQSQVKLPSSPLPAPEHNDSTLPSPQIQKESHPALVKISEPYLAWNQIQSLLDQIGSTPIIFYKKKLTVFQLFMKCLTYFGFPIRTANTAMKLFEYIYLYNAKLNMFTIKVCCVFS